MPLTLAFAARGQTAVFDVDGRAQSGATVLVKAPDGTTATLYTDRARSATIPNPTAADAFGQVEFYSDQLGVYTLRITTAAGTFDREVEALADPADDAFQSDVDDALAALVGHEVAHPGHRASDVSVDSVAAGLTSTDVQAALAELRGLGSELPVFVIEDYVRAGDVNDSEAFNRVAVQVNLAGGGIVRGRTGRIFVVQKQTLTGHTGGAGSWVPSDLLAFSHTTAPVIVEGVKAVCAAGLRVGQFDPVTGAAKGIVDYAVQSGGSATQDSASLADVISTDRCGPVALVNVMIDGNMANLVKGGAVGVAGDTSYEVNGTGIALKGATLAILQNVDINGMVVDNIEINDPDVTETSEPHHVIIDGLRSTYAGRHTMWIGGANSLTMRNFALLHAGRGQIGATYSAACDIEGYLPKCVMNIHMEDGVIADARGQLAASGGGTINAKNITHDRVKLFATGSKAAVNSGCPNDVYRDCEIHGPVGSLFGDPDPRRATRILDTLITDRPLTPALVIVDHRGAPTLTAMQKDPTAGTVTVTVLADDPNRWRLQVRLDTGSGPVLQSDYRNQNTVNTAVAVALAADPYVTFGDAASPNANPNSQPAPLAATPLPISPVSVTPSSQTAVAVNVVDQLGVPTVSVKQKNFTRAVAFQIAAGTAAGTWKLLVYVDAIAQAVGTFDNLTTIAGAVTATAGSLWVTLNNLASTSSGTDAYPVVTAKTTLTSTISYAASALIPTLVPENALLSDSTLDAYTVRPYSLSGQNRPGAGPGIFERITAIFRQTAVDGAPLSDKAVAAQIRAPLEVRGFLNNVEGYPAGFVAPAHGFYIDAPINFQCYLLDSAGKVTVSFTPKAGIEGALMAMSAGPGTASGFKVVLYYFGTRVAVETYDNLATPAAAVATINAASNLVTTADQLSNTAPPGNNPATATLQRFPGLRIAAGSHVSVPGPTLALGTWDPTQLGTYAQGRVGPTDPAATGRLSVNAVGPSGLVQRRPDPARIRPPGITIGPVLPAGYHEKDDVHENTDTTSPIIRYDARQSGWSPSDWVARSVATPAVVVGQGALVVANTWIASSHSTRTTLALTNQRMALTPLWLTKTIHITFMRVEITALAAGASINLGIYADSFNVPAAKLGQATGSVDASTATGALGGVSLPIDLTLAPGLVWLAVASLGAATVRAINAANYTLASTSNPEGTTNSLLSRTNNGVTGATLPDPANAAATSGSAPLVWLFTDSVS